MKNICSLIDPVKKDYVVDNFGNLVNDPTLKTPAYIRLKTPRQNWLLAPDKNFGSDFYLIRKNITSSDVSKYINTAERALAPLIDQNRASDVTVEIADRARHGAALSIKITDIKSENDQELFVPVGGIP